MATEEQHERITPPREAARPTNATVVPRDISSFSQWCDTLEEWSRDPQMDINVAETDLQARLQGFLETHDVGCCLDSIWDAAKICPHSVVFIRAGGIVLLRLRDGRT